MDLHAWITQQVDRVEQRARACTATDWRHVFDGVIVDRDTDGWQSAPDNAVIARVDYDRIYWSTSPAHSPEADHIVTHDPDAVLRRCEADRRILARHREWAQSSYCEACDQDLTTNLNDCPELLDLAHAHGITDDILAGLDRPQPPEPKPHAKVAHTPAGAQRIARLLATPPITTSDVPAALRGPRWKP
jgi:hypothetical protein